MWDETIFVYEMIGMVADDYYLIEDRDSWFVMSWKYFPYQIQNSEYIILLCWLFRDVTRDSSSVVQCFIRVLIWSPLDQNDGGLCRLDTASKL